MSHTRSTSALSRPCLLGRGQEEGRSPEATEECPKLSDSPTWSWLGIFTLKIFKKTKQNKRTKENKKKIFLKILRNTFLLTLKFFFWLLLENLIMLSIFYLELLRIKHGKKQLTKSHHTNSWPWVWYQTWRIKNHDSPSFPPKVIHLKKAKPTFQSLFPFSK